ncbi:MAG TPA: J domain-containing protein [Gaiellales bacterium]
MVDPYEIIGVSRDASLDEIRAAYRRSAQVVHPDRFESSNDGVRAEAERRMLQLNAAMDAIEAERAVQPPPPAAAPDGPDVYDGDGGSALTRVPRAPAPARRRAQERERERARR